MPQMGFEQPTISAFEQEKIFHALERAATVIGMNIFGGKNVELLNAKSGGAYSWQCT
jgi:hypothetical protein